jgi:flagellar export protein FliJ
MKFKFKLESLHKYKKQLVDVERQKFASLLKRIGEINQEIEALGVEIDMQLQEHSGVTIHGVQELKQKESYLRARHLRRSELDQEKKRLEQQMMEQKMKLQQAHKDSEMMEKSREKAFTLFQENLQKSTEKFLNEQSIQRFQRV